MLNSKISSPLSAGAAVDHTKTLPDELLLQIFKMGTADTLIKERQVCRRWYNVSFDGPMVRGRIESFDGTQVSKGLAAPAVDAVMIRKLRTQRNIAKGCAAVTDILGHDSTLTHGCLSPSARRAVTCSNNGSVHLHSFENNEVMSTQLVGHAGGVASANFSPCERWVATCDDRGVVGIWDTHQAQPTMIMAPGHTQHATAVVFSADGKRLASVGRDSTLVVSDFLVTEEGASAQLLHLLQHTGPLTGALFLPDGRLVVAGYNTLAVWSGLDDEQPSKTDLKGHSHMIWDITLSRDGSLLVSGSEDKTARVWDLNASPITSKVLAGHTGGVWRGVVSRDNTRVITASADKTALVWDITQEPSVVVSTLGGHGTNTGQVAFSLDGGVAITSGTTREALLRTWKLDQGAAPKAAQLVPYKMPPPLRDWWNISSVSLSADGDKMLVTGSNNEARILDFAPVENG